MKEIVIVKRSWYRRLCHFLRKKPTAAHLTGADAQNAQGLEHWTGENSPANLAHALDCFQQAADLGHAGAQNNLATMLAGGQGVARDSEQALEWFLRAAKQGDASAQFNLAARYHRANVRGLSPDASEGRVEALMWFLLSAAQNYSRAEEWCNRLRLDMSREEVAEASRRAKEFVPLREDALLHTALSHENH